MVAIAKDKKDLKLLNETSLPFFKARGRTPLEQVFPFIFMA